MTDTPKKRGAKPIGEKALTAAERQKRWREKQKASKVKKEPMKHLSFSIDEGSIQIIDGLVKSLGFGSRSKLIQTLLVAGIASAQKYEKEMIECAAPINLDNPSYVLAKWQELTRDHLRRGIRFEDYRVMMDTLENEQEDNI